MDQLVAAVLLSWGLSLQVPPPEFPPLTDLDRFPPPAVTEAGWRFACAYREHLRGQCVLHVSWQADYDRLLQRSLWHYQVWDWIDDAVRLNWMEPEWRRERLGRVRDLLGAEAYGAGRLPPPVPLECLRRLP